MSDDKYAPPIQFAIAEIETLVPGAERYETRELAEAALEELEDSDAYTIVETRDGHRPPDDVLAAEEEQIERQGFRDGDEPSAGEE